MSKMNVVENVLATLSKPATSPIAKTTFAFLKPHQRPNPILHVRKPEVNQQPTSSGTLPIGEEKILSACIQFPNGVIRRQLTVLTGFKRSTRDAYIARLREKRLVDVNGENVFATLEGEGALPNAQPLPVGQELQQHWMNRLPEGERRIFEILVSSYPNAVDREFISEQTGFKRSTRDAYLSRMSAKMLFIEPARGQVRASDQLF